MLRSFITGIGLLLCSVMFAQDMAQYNTAGKIYYRFIYFPRRYDIHPVFHNQWDEYNIPNVPDTKLKRDYLYQYIHNGDNVKMAQDVFTNEVRRTWFRNFDMGEFMNLTFQLSPDHKTQPHAPFQWSGSLAFFKLFHHKPIGKMRRRLVKD